MTTFICLWCRRYFREPGNDLLFCCDECADRYYAARAEKAEP